MQPPGRGGLPGLAVRRPVTVVMSLAALLVVGFIANREIPVQLVPTGFDPPFMWVDVPGLPAAPSDHERDIALPVEEVLATLPRLERIRTFVRSSGAGFMVELKGDADVNVAYQQVRDRLDRVMPRLPDGVRQAFIWRHNPNDDPVYILGLTYPEGADDPHETVRTKLARPVERLPGVSRVRIWGTSPRKVRVELDDGLARAHGVDTTTLVKALEQDNFTMALGAIEEGGRRILVRAVARFESLDDVRALPVKEGVRLSDVARVHIAPDPEPVIHRIDGAPAVTLMVYKEATANTIDVCESVAAETSRILGEGRSMGGWGGQVFFDQGGYIQGSIDYLKRSALYGGAIAVVLLFLFLRYTGMTLLVTLAIPLCLLTTVVVLYFLGDSLNLMSMMGLMLSVGMVIDNAIVVLENIDRYGRAGLSRKDAAVGGAREVSLAITLATLTTMVVFLPMVLLGGSPMVAFFLGKIGFPVCYALLMSLLAALVYIPAGARWLPARPEKPLGPLFTGLQNVYARILGWTLEHRVAATLIVVGVIVSVSFPMDRVQKVDQVRGGMDAIRVHIVGPPNGSHDELDATVRMAEKNVIEKKAELEVRAVLARRGWNNDHAMLQIFFVGVDERERERSEVIDEIRELLPKRPGYKTRVGWRGSGNSEGGVNLAVTGPDTEVATELAAEVAVRLRRLEPVDEASLDEPQSGTELRFRVDREGAEKFGLSPVLIGGTIDYSLRGRRLGDFHGRDTDLDMVVELAPEDRAEVGQLQLRDVVPLRGAELARDTGRERPGAPLALVTTTERAAGYGRIVRENRRTMVKINVTGDDKALFAALAKELPQIKLPPGYGVDFGARFRRMQENEEGGNYALLVAVALVFFLMGVLFESFILPFSILLTVPLAFVGVFWTLYLTDTPLDIMAIVGCIILVGVVVNNGIVLIDQVQQRRASGLKRTEALIEAARNRVRPILMTALTTVGGLVPMAVGHASLLGIEYYPLGRVVIGGLLSSTVFTLFAVPLLYSLLDDLSHLPRRVRMLAGARVAGETATTPQ